MLWPSQKLVKEDYYFLKPIFISKNTRFVLIYYTKILEAGATWRKTIIMFFLISNYICLYLLSLSWKNKICTKPARTFGTSEIHPVSAWAPVHRGFTHGSSRKVCAWEGKWLIAYLQNTIFSLLLYHQRQH